MEIILWILILIFSVVIHEVSHGIIALQLGDPTAKHAGRLTLNPLPHLDLIGSIFLPLFLLIITGGKGPIFGWAKPVPVNPFLLRGKYAELKVALAGPGANFFVALILALFLRFSLDFLPPATISFLSSTILLNLILAIFNLLPIPPLDGHHILFSLLSPRYFYLKAFLFQWGFIILLFVIFFFREIVFLPALLIFQLLVGV